jgi:predicted transcriptional regulator
MRIQRSEFWVSSRLGFKIFAKFLYFLNRCSVADLIDLTEIPSDRLDKCIRLLVENELVEPPDFVNEIVTTKRGISFLNFCDEINGLVVTDRRRS